MSFAREARMSSQADPIPRPRRRYLRFSVRGLIVVVLVIGGWLGSIVRSARIQREAVAAIEKAGGEVWYDWEWKDGKAIQGGSPWMPGWVANRAGIDCFGNVVAARISPEDAEDTMVQVGRLSRLEHLELNNHYGTDLWTIHLASLTNLSDLDLARTQVTDSGLVHLNGLIRLSSLNLRNTQVTDAGLVHLKCLTGLSKLRLAETRVTDLGLVHLKGLTKLSTLVLDDTQVTDAGMFYVGGFSKLSHLSVDGTQASDAGLGYLKGLTNLVSLSLGRTQVTDLAWIPIEGKSPIISARSAMLNPYIERRGFVSF